VLAPRVFRLRPRRPVGVTLLAVWSLVVGVSILALAAFAVYALRQIPRVFEAFLAFPDALVAVAGLVAALQFAAAIGLWSLRRWGWVLSLGLSFAGVVAGALTLPFGAFGILFALASVWYLTRRPVREAFGLAHQAAAGS